MIVIRHCANLDTGEIVNGTNFLIAGHIAEHRRKHLAEMQICTFKAGRHFICKSGKNFLCRCNIIIRIRQIEQCQIRNERYLRSRISNNHSDITKLNTFYQLCIRSQL